MFDYPLVVDVRVVDSRVFQVAIQVVKLVQVKRVALVCDNIEQEALIGIGIFALVIGRVALDQIHDQLTVILGQLSKLILLCFKQVLDEHRRGVLVLPLSRQHFIIALHELINAYVATLLSSCSIRLHGR